MSPSDIGASGQGLSEATQTSSTATSSNTGQSPASSSNMAQQSTASSSSAASQPTQEGSDATQASTSTGEHASFGDVTSKSGECVVGNPDKYVSTADIDWHRETFQDGGIKVPAMLERQYPAWNRWLIGCGCWPYSEIKINVVGFAVKESSLLDWKDDSLGTIYEGELDAEGIPQCPQTCYRFFDNAPQTWSDTSGCKGEPFDLSLWPKQGLEGGFGYDWGQEVNLENMLQTIDEEQLTIVATKSATASAYLTFTRNRKNPIQIGPSVS
ncbi:unnamed protein product [Phytophthora fragariaefolia]|uniref:Unnamed protein product n=1 Tax=Phytophthora fragariaefolia TaxID=1490495 RepID=A0A9W7CNW5_9STRA|nr:unnamed protein product [Phytophthora fragariaefolia]